MALTRRALGGLTIGGSVAAALSACGGDDGGGSGANELVWAIPSSWDSWNLNTLNGNNSYCNQALTPMNPLGQVGIDFDPNAQVVYDDALLAQDPELVSEEPMQIRYVLNENAQWSDGEPVRVEDFIFQWYSLSGKEEHANQEKAAPASDDWGSKVASIEQQDDGSILVTYVDGYIDPEWQFISMIYLPSHLADAEGFDWQNDPEAMGDAIQWFDKTAPTVGLGPYKPVDAKVGEYIVYEINENYQGSIKPTIEKITMQVVEGTDSIVTELRQGSIAGAWATEYNEEELAKLEENPDLENLVYDGSVWQHFDLNLNNKFLSDTALRQAVFTAIDVQDICDKVYPESGVQRKGSHFFRHDSDYYVDYVGDVGQGLGDADAARQILTDAGYTWDSNDRLLTPDGEQVTFNIRYGEGDVGRTTSSELAQSYLDQIGITAELVAIPDGDLGPVLEGADYDMIIYGWSGNAAFTVSPGQYFNSSSGSNYGGYSNPEADEAISKVRSTYDIDEAAEYSNEVGKVVAPDAYTLPLFDEPQATVYNTKLVEGITANGYSQSGPIWNVREWKLV